jgi:hypothetical protein
MGIRFKDVSYGTIIYACDFNEPESSSSFEECPDPPGCCAICSDSTLDFLQIDPIANLPAVTGCDNAKDIDDEEPEPIFNGYFQKIKTPPPFITPPEGKAVSPCYWKYCQTGVSIASGALSYKNKVIDDAFIYYISALQEDAHWGPVITRTWIITITFVKDDLGMDQNFILIRGDYDADELAAALEDEDKGLYNTILQNCDLENIIWKWIGGCDATEAVVNITIESADSCGPVAAPCDHAPWATLQLSVSNSSFGWLFGEEDPGGGGDIPNAFAEPCLIPCATSGSTTPITLQRSTSPAGAEYRWGEEWTFLDCHWYGYLCLGGREALIILVAYGDGEVPESLAGWDLRIYFPVDWNAEHPEDDPEFPPEFNICRGYSGFYPWEASAVYDRFDPSPLGTYTKLYDDTSGTVPATIDVQEVTSRTKNDREKAKIKKLRNEELFNKSEPVKSSCGGCGKSREKLLKRKEEKMKEVIMDEDDITDEQAEEAVQKLLKLNPLVFKSSSEINNIIEGTADIINENYDYFNNMLKTPKIVTGEPLIGNQSDQEDTNANTKD